MGLPYYNTGTISTSGGNTPNLTFAGGADPVANIAIGYGIILPDGPNGAQQLHIVMGIGTGTATVAPNVTNQLAGASFVAFQCSGMSVKAVQDLNTLLTSSNFSQIAGLNPSDGSFLEYFAAGGWVTKTPLEVLVKLLSSIVEENVAAAATTDIGSGTSIKKLITGSGVTITSLGTTPNCKRIVRFAGANTLANSASLILMGGANHPTAANDMAEYTSDAAGNWRERSYTRAAIAPADYVTKSETQTLTGKTMGATTFTGAITTNGQIAFPAAQNGSSDPNTLDDYEEGTFTPTLGATTTDPTGLTYSSQLGWYRKVGSVVFVNMRLVLTNKGTGGSGNTLIRGLPFTVMGNLAYAQLTTRFGNITLQAGYTWCVGFAQSADTFINLQQCGSAVMNTNLSYADAIADTSSISVTGSYFV